jgi:hypothetical protein
VKACENKAPEELPALEKDYSLWIWRNQNPAVMVPLPLVTPDRLIETHELATGGETTELEGSRWQLVSLNDTELLAGTIITLKLQDMEATGSSECNLYGGKYKTKAPNLLNIYELTTTAMDCGELVSKGIPHRRALTLRAAKGLCPFGIPEQGNPAPRAQGVLRK